MLAVRRCWDALGLSGRPCGAVRLLACLTGDLAKGGEGCPVAGRLVSAVSCIVALALGCAAVLRLVGLRAWRCRRRQPPPTNARKALTVLVLGAGWRRASPISTHKPARGVSSVRVDWDSGGAAKNWDSPPGPRSGDREGDPARVG